jgi:uncharacterized protein (DUF2132 family)
MEPSKKKQNSDLQKNDHEQTIESNGHENEVSENVEIDPSVEAENKIVETKPKVKLTKKEKEIKLESMKADQPNNPVHGVRLLDMLKYLEQHMGWEAMGNHIDIRCFTIDPTIGSSLTFLRKTPWAKDRLQALYIQCVTKTLPEVDKRKSFVEQIEKRILSKKRDK